MHRGRRAAIGALAWAWLGGTLARPAQVPTGSEGSPSPDAGRLGLVAEAEAALARGDVVAASEGFERAGAMRHAADSEMGLVRAAMQVGDYRRALAFCAHVAGEHLDEPGAALLYAWLLRVGGRRDVADQVLRETLERTPDDPLIATAMRALASPLPVASAPMLDVPHRVAPFATFQAGALPPAVATRILSSGVLMPDGRHALLPGRTRSARVWVRDGLGATREALLDEPGDGVVTRWRLTTPIVRETAADLGRDAVAGAPVFAVEYAESPAATPAWPWLRAGFLGASTRAGDAFRLGVDIAAAHAGGPVLDRAGRLVGIALRDADGRPTMRPAALWPFRSGDGAETSQRRLAPSPAADPGFDQIYELALRSALQVIAVA